MFNAVCVFGHGFNAHLSNMLYEEASLELLASIRYVESLWQLPAARPQLNEKNVHSYAEAVSSLRKEAFLSVDKVSSNKHGNKHDWPGVTTETATSNSKPSPAHTE